MGYRSDVKMAFRFDDEQELSAALVKFKLTESYQGDGADPLDDIEIKDCVIKFHAEDWKWYPSYSDVKRMEAFWVFMDEKTNADSAFIRIGEDDTDIETRSGGDGCDLIRLHRYTEFEV